MDAAWLKLPVVGRIARGYNAAARFAPPHSRCWPGAGVPILRALQTAPETRTTACCAPMRSMRWCWCARERRWRRVGVEEALSWPGRDVSRRLGEQTSQLRQPCSGARPAQLGAGAAPLAAPQPALLEPLLIVAMGLVVMLIVLAVLLPIIQLNQLVK